MIKVRLTSGYANWYWNSATGVTLRKDDREGKEVNEDDHQIRLAMEQGILEVVTKETVAKDKEESKIITDIPSQPTMKEVVTPSNAVEMKKIKKSAKKKGDDSVSG